MNLSLLQDFAVSRLREPKIHYLIQQFINDDEIISNALLFQLFEVLTEHLQIQVNAMIKAGSMNFCGRIITYLDSSV